MWYKCGCEKCSFGNGLACQPDCPGVEKDKEVRLAAADEFNFPA